MSDAAKLLTEIIDYFAVADENPGDDWAHDSDFESYCLDHRSKDGTKFWIDLEKDGTISVLWKPFGQQEPTVINFTAAVSGAPKESGNG